MSRSRSSASVGEAVGDGLLRGRAAGLVEHGEVEALGEAQLEHHALDAARLGVEQLAAGAGARPPARRAAYVAGCSTFHQRTPPTWLCAPGPIPHQSPPRQ